MNVNALAVIADDAELPPSNSLSLSLPANLPFDRWQEVGRELAAREKVLNWWIGDWWAFGERAYGEARAQAAAVAAFGSYDMIRNCGWVASKFEVACRHADLSFTHHQEVAGLGHEDAQRLLAAAEAPVAAGEKPIPVSKLRSEVRKLNVELGKVTPREVVDPEYQEFLAIAIAWNNARESVREDVKFMLDEIGTGVISL